MEDMHRINRQAMLIYNDGKIDQTRQMLEKNAQEYPCLMTLNNLGAFYIDDGTLEGDPYNIGFDYLSRARQYGIHRKNVVALGYIHAICGRNQESISSFTDALALKEDFSVLYNLGVINLRMKKYEKALDFFRRSINYMSSDEDIPEMVYAGILWCLIQTHKKNAHEVYDSMELSTVEYLGLELCAYAYSLEEYEKVGIHYEALKNKEVSSQCTMAMIYDSYSRLEKLEEMRECLENYLSYLGEFTSEEDIEQLKKEITEEPSRKKLIANYNFQPEIYCDCRFIECPQHPD